MKRHARIALVAVAVLFIFALGAVLTSGKAHAQPAATDYETVAVSQTDQTLGPVGGAGDVLQRLVVNVTTAATSTVSIKDGGGGAIDLMPANTPVGIYTIDIGARSTAGAWKVTTGAGASVLAIGRFK